MSRNVTEEAISVVSFITIFLVYIDGFLLCVFTFWLPCCHVRSDVRIINDIRFVFTSSHRDLLPVNKKMDYPHICTVYMWIVDLFIDREQVPVLQLFVRGLTSCIYIICICLRVVVLNTYYCVFLFSLSVFVVYVASFYGLSFFDCPFDIPYRLFPVSKVWSNNGQNINILVPEFEIKGFSFSLW